MAPAIPQAPVFLLMSQKSAHRGVDLHSKSPSFWDGMSCKCQRLAQITKLYSSFFLRRWGRVTLGYRPLWRPQCPGRLGTSPASSPLSWCPQAYSLIPSQIPLAGLPYKLPQEPPQDQVLTVGPTFPSGVGGQPHLSPEEELPIPEISPYLPCQLLGQ